MGNKAQSLISDMRSEYGDSADALTPFLWEHVRKQVRLLAAAFAGVNHKQVQWSLGQKEVCMPDIEALVSSGTFAQILHFVEGLDVGHWSSLDPNCVFLQAELASEFEEAITDRLRKLLNKVGSTNLKNHLKGCGACGFLYGDRIAEAKFCPQCGASLTGGKPAVVAEVTKPPVVPDPKPSEVPDAQLDALHAKLNTEIETLELSVRTANAMQNANLEFVGHLVQRTEAEVMKFKNFGSKSRKEVKDILGEMGLNLGMTNDELRGWQPPVTQPVPEPPVTQPKPRGPQQWP